MFRPKIDRVEYGGAIITQEERDAIFKVIDSQGGRRWTIGPESEALEIELAQKTGVKRAVLTNSGSSALLVALAALKLKKGANVVIPALNFPTAFNAIIQNGYHPVVIDVDKNMLLDLDAMEELVKTWKIEAVVAVNIASNPVDLERLREIVGPDVKIVLDNCIARGTLVKTINGDIPIENIQVGDMVLTRRGYKKVLRTMYKGVQPVIERFGVTATPDHKFITTDGKKELNVLQPSDILYTCNSDIKAISTIDIQNQNTGIKESIGTVQAGDMDIYTDINGKMNTEKYQKDILSTTKTATHLTMILKILKPLLRKNILGDTFQKMEDWILPIITLIKQGSEHLNGINQTLVNSFTPNTISGYGLLERNQPTLALSVGANIKHTGRQNPSIAQGSVSQEAEVYDLTVDDAHEFFANGVLVSNCDGYGTLIGDKFVENFADISCVSFHAAHIITMGEGGAILTDNEELADRSKKMREWGRASGTDKLYVYPGFPKDYRERYVYEEIGWNLKPLELQCAMGRVQLKKLEAFRLARWHNYGRLKFEIDKLSQYETVHNLVDSIVCWFSFPFYCRGVEREVVMQTLEENNIECRTIFSGNILKHPAYQKIDVSHPMNPNKDFKGADDVMFNGVFISVHPSITQEMIDFIVEVLGGIK